MSLTCKAKFSPLPVVWYRLSHLPSYRGVCTFRQTPEFPLFLYYPPYSMYELPYCLETY